MNKLVHEVSLDETQKIAHVISEDEVATGAMVVNEEDIDSAPRSIEVAAVKSASDFIQHLKGAALSIPRYSTNSLNSIRRTFAYIDGLRDEIIQAAAQDADYADFTAADLHELDQLECDLETHAVKLHAAVKVAEQRYAEVARELKVASIDPNDTPKGIERVAYKASGDNFYYDSFHFSIARILINAKVTGGKNVNELYGKLQSKYSLDERDKLNVLFAMRDMGYPITNSLIGGDDMLQRYFN